MPELVGLQESGSLQALQQGVPNKVKYRSKPQKSEALMRRLEVYQSYRPREAGKEREIFTKHVE